MNNKLQVTDLMVPSAGSATGRRNQLLRISDVYADSRQDGLLGMALHDDILGDNPYVYLSYTYLLDGDRRQRLMRYTFNDVGNNSTLSAPLTLIENLPASNDHNSGRLIFGPDGKLYYTIGDQGNNQNRNYCAPVLSQVLPTQGEIDTLNWTNYPGKTLRLNTDGSIPDDNPLFNGVESHIFSSPGNECGPLGRLAYGGVHLPAICAGSLLAPAGGGPVASSRPLFWYPQLSTYSISMKPVLVVVSSEPVMGRITFRLTSKVPASV